MEQERQVQQTEWRGQLEAAVFKPDQFPPEIDGCPEVAVAGRSNVGKSSLINSLLGAKMAHVGNKPGKTRSVNFYRVTVRLKEQEAQTEFRLVDLPGYGYAARSRTERDEWRRLISRCMEQRSAMRLVCHLVDFRHGLLENDRELQEWLRQWGRTIQVVFTKSDKITRGRRRETLMQYVKAGLYSTDVPILTSSEGRLGIDELRAFVEREVLGFPTIE